MSVLYRTVNGCDPELSQSDCLCPHCYGDLAEEPRDQEKYREGRRSFGWFCTVCGTRFFFAPTQMKKNP